MGTLRMPDQPTAPSIAPASWFPPSIGTLSELNAPTTVENTLWLLSNCPSGQKYKSSLPTSLHGHDSIPISFLCPSRHLFSPIVLLVMAVQAQHVSRAFHHDLHSYRALEDRANGASLFIDELGGCAPAMGNTMLSDVPRSDLTCNDNNYNSAFVPRKRARVAAAAAASGFMDEGPRGVRTPAAAHGFVPVGDMANRAMGSGVASTSGMIGNAAGSVSQGLLSQLYNQGMEIDAPVRVETERMCARLGEAWRRHARALVAAAERAAEGRLRAAEAALELARCQNAELEERLRQIGAEGQAWIGVAQSHEAVAAGLRATLDQLLQSPCAAGASDAEDARSCCFETPAHGADDAASNAPAACKACGQGGACVLLLPCRHLSLCRSCDATVDTCPVCAATKNASLHILLC
uniref:Uncharacterized protein n=1 Tax=Avena sativa TaxID=4498 RepID=A0ACD5UP87_AVESA